ncbi:MAG: tRNA pseudouridine(13) synthase TruD [Gammaproteobacteria bacterium]|nr:tRNA pseudouridine(13) synthase TruD [Gammaproteobacteria bacterium]
MTEKAWGEPLGTGLLAREPEDFVVHEQLGFNADNDGPHLLIQIEKSGLTTLEALRAIAKAWGVRERECGYAGRKDRWAVTTQWFTVPWPVNQPLPEAPSDIATGLSVLQVARHRRKLKVGSLAGNRFRLRLREVSASAQSMNQRLAQIATYGVPNYFGPQRFGRNGRNLKDAVAWLVADPKSVPPAGRGMLISTLRSACFNQVLCARVKDGSWASALSDDLMGLDGRESLFPASRETPARLRWRIAAQQIHPTGPLPGSHHEKLGVTPALSQREAEILKPVANYVTGLTERRVEAARRPLRVAVGALGWHQSDSKTWMLDFYLRRGSYATSVVAELIDWSAPQ